MNLRKYFITGAIVGAMGIAASVLPAEVVPSCETPGVTYSSLQRSADLLTRVQRDDWAVQDHIRDSRIVRSRVARMSRRIEMLESMGPAVPACEQTVVQQAAQLVQQMKVAVSQPAHRVSLQAEADALDNLMQRNAHFARVVKRAAYLEPNLGMTELFR